MMDTAKSNKTLFRLFQGLLGFLGLTALVILASFLIREDVDWAILRAINLGSAIPILDVLMVMVTDFSMAGLGLIFLSWEILYQISKQNARIRKNAGSILKTEGILCSLFVFSALFWSDHDRPVIFIPLTLLTLVAFGITSKIFTRSDERDLYRFHKIFWLTLIAVAMTEISAEVIIKKIVARPRPLSGVNAPLNEALRRVPGEVVRGGYSYVAGHASVFFAMITPLMWAVSKNTIRGLLLLWALSHAFSRVYLAAHFPFCSLMGSVLGFLMGTLVIKCSGLWEKDNHPLARS